MRIEFLAAAVASALIAVPGVAQQPATGAAAPQADNSRPARTTQHRAPGHMWAGLSEEGQNIVKSAMGTPEERNADRQKMQAQMQKLHGLMAAENLDLDALRAEMGEQNKLMSEMTVKKQQNVLTILPQLSAQDRKAFADALHGTRARAHNRSQKTGKWMRKNKADAPATGEAAKSE